MWALQVGSVQYATEEEQRAITNSSRKNEEAGPKQKWHLVVDASGGESKVQCCKVQYCIGTWNFRSMNQGKLNVVTQKMAILNIHILGLSELKCMEMGQFNSGDHYIYYSGQESLKRNEVAHSQQKSPKCSIWVQSQKRQNDLGLFPMQTIQYQSNPSLCPNCCCQRSWSCLVLWRPTKPSRTNTRKRCPFHHWGLECKVGSQEIPRITGKFCLGMQHEAGQRLTVLSREHAGHSKHSFPITWDDFTHGHHHMVNTEIRLIVFFAAEDGEALYSQEKQDLELTCGPDPY